MKKTKPEKVNWRNEYLRDNIFNVVMIILTLGVVVYEVSLNEGEPMIGLLYLILPVQLFINLSASKFFNSNKYE